MKCAWRTSAKGTFRERSPDVSRLDSLENRRVCKNVQGDYIVGIIMSRNADFYKAVAWK